MTLLIALLSLLLPADLAQTSAVNAVAVLDKAIQAHGGLPAMQAIKDITREFDSTGTGLGQGVRPESHTANPFRQTSIRDFQRHRMLEGQEATPPRGQVTRTVQVITNELGFAASPTLKMGAKVPVPALPQFHARFNRRHPESLLMNAASRPEALRLLGDETFEGQAQHVIAYADTDGTAVSLFFDAATGLMTKVSVVTDDPVLGDTSTDLVFKDYSTESGVQLPHRYQEMLGGIVTRDSRVTALHINTNPADGLFVFPDDYTHINQTPSQGTVKMADNVYLVKGAYNTMFTVLPDYVVVIEGPQSNAVSDQMLREIAKVAPGKPVRYVVVTHFHYDHISGIRRWVAEGATIVCTPTARQTIEQAVKAQHRLRPDALSRNPKAPVFEIVQGKTRVFEGGGVKLEVRDISPLTHVAEMLVAFFPDAHLLYEADHISIPLTGKMIAGPNTREFVGKIDGWGVDTIVEVHGPRTTTLGEVKEAVAAAK